VLSVNVEQLSTRCEPAPMSSDILFRTSARLKVPQDVSLEELQRSLERLADDLMVEIK
jgi:glycine cleavage system regulatory protein